MTMAAATVVTQLLVLIHGPVDGAGVTSCFPNQITSDDDPVLVPIEPSVGVNWRQRKVVYCCFGAIGVMGN